MPDSEETKDQTVTVTGEMVEAAMDLLDERGWTRPDTKGIPAFAFAEADVRDALCAALQSPHPEESGQKYTLDEFRAALRSDELADEVADEESEGEEGLHSDFVRGLLGTAAGSGALEVQLGVYDEADGPAAPEESSEAGERDWKELIPGGVEEWEGLRRVFNAAATTVFWMGDPDRLRENLGAQRAAIVSIGKWGCFCGKPKNPDARICSDCAAELGSAACEVCRGAERVDKHQLWPRSFAPGQTMPCPKCASSAPEESSQVEGAGDSYYLCFGCEHITHADRWTYLQMDEGQYRAVRDGDEDSHLKCPSCGEMHGDNYVGDGLEEGTLAECEAAKAEYLTDDPAAPTPAEASGSSGVPSVIYRMHDPAFPRGGTYTESADFAEGCRKRGEIVTVYRKPPGSPRLDEGEAVKRLERAGEELAAQIRGESHLLTEDDPNHHAWDGPMGRALSTWNEARNSLRPDLPPTDNSAAQPQHPVDEELPKWAQFSPKCSIRLHSQCDGKAKYGDGPCVCRCHGDPQPDPQHPVDEATPSEPGGRS